MNTKRGRPEDFCTSVTMPPDFETFWQEVEDELAAIPPDIELRPVPYRSTPEVEVFELLYTSLQGVRISSWYCRPTERLATGAFPGLALVPGYVSDPTLPKSWAKRGYAAMGVAPRGKLRSNSQYNPGYPGLLIDRIGDKNTYAYRAFYADAIRAIDVLATLDEVDASRIGVHGGSQGGALSLVAAAMRPNLIACSALNAPYLTGYMDSAALTHSYPYEEMNEFFHNFPDQKEKARETLNYFDCLNFAPKITAPLFLYVGLADDVCPPETAYNLLDALNTEVEFHPYERSAHEAGLYWALPLATEFLARHLTPEVHGVDVDPVVDEVLTPEVGGATATALSSEGDEPETPGSSRTSLPDGFEAYWASIEEELAATPGNLELFHDPVRSTDICDIYLARMTSIDHQIISAWVSIPTGEGPFPGVFYPSAHMSVVTSAPYEFRQRAVTMNVISRGQRLADKPYAGGFPGHLTEGLPGPDTYVMRGVFADHLRAWEMFLSLPKLDVRRTAISGTDIGLVVEARRPGAAGVYVSGSFWYRLPDLAAATDAYPFEEINDHLRTYPGQEEQVRETLALFDPVNHVGVDGAPVYVNMDAQSAVADDDWFRPLTDRLGDRTSFYQLTHEGQTDYDAADAWISGRVGMQASPRLWTPEDIGEWSI